MLSRELASRGKDGINLRQHGLLDFAGHLEVLFHLLVALAQSLAAAGKFRGGFADLFLGALALRNVPENSLQTGDVALGIMQRRFDDVNVNHFAFGRLVLFDRFKQFVGLHDAAIVASDILPPARGEKDRNPSCR